MMVLDERELGNVPQNIHKILYIIYSNIFQTASPFSSFSFILFNTTTIFVTSATDIRTKKKHGKMIGDT